MDFTNRVIYYVGRLTRCATSGARPPTATRMDKFLEMMLAETGLISMVGKDRAWADGHRCHQNCTARPHLMAVEALPTWCPSHRSRQGRRL